MKPFHIDNTDKRKEKYLSSILRNVCDVVLADRWQIKRNISESNNEKNERKTLRFHKSQKQDGGIHKKETCKIRKKKKWFVIRTTAVANPSKPPDHL